MNRNNVSDESEIKRLDDINNRRYEDCKKRLAEVISLLKRFTYQKYDNSQFEGDELEEVRHDIAKAVNKLEVSAEEMEWHCEWFGYDSGVCCQMNDACVDFGRALALTFDAEHEATDIEADINDGLVKMSKALATLVRWND